MPAQTNTGIIETFSIDNLIQKEVSLASYNTFRFAYNAEYFAIAEDLDTLKKLAKWANNLNLPITMIGGGSNLLVSDYISGLVIVNRLSGITSRALAGNLVSLVVSAGENWHQIVEFTVTEGLFGIENLALIPGTVGAAPVQNIGAYGVEVKDVVARVQVLNKQSGDVTWINANDCGFAYRDSYFKGKWKDIYFITAVEFLLKTQADFKLSYGGLSNQIVGAPNLQKVFDTVCRIRNEKLPNPSDLANSGSFFKNPIVSKPQRDDLVHRFPDLVSFPFEGAYKLAAGWLIDNAGWKGKKYQGVGVYEKQALVLVNYTETQAQPLLELEANIKSSVLALYGVELEREPVQLPINDKNEVN